MYQLIIAKWNHIFKALHSVINMGITILITLPFYDSMDFADWKELCVKMFFGYNAVCECIFGRCLGMIICGTHYTKQFGMRKKVWYILLYTLSFSTIFYNIWFFGDLALFNVLVIQGICVRKTGNTLHGYLTGIKTICDEHLVKT